MLVVKFNDELRNSLDTLISGLLPHESYNPELFMDIYENITRFIHIDEMPLEYRVLFNIIFDVLKISTITNNFFPIISKEVVDSTLEIGLTSYISENGYRDKKWFDERGLDSNFNIAMNIEDGASSLYSEVSNLYSRCFDKRIPSEESISFILSFKTCFTLSVSEAMVMAQVEMLQDKFYHDNKYYKGVEDWLLFINSITSELGTRLNDDLFSSSEAIDSIEKAKRMIEKSRSMFKPLAKYGIPEIDDKTPILAHRLVVICSQENVGKTLYCQYLVNNIMSQDLKVLFMCGESPEPSIYTGVLCNFIYKRFNKFITPGQIAAKEEITDDIDRLINIAASTMAQEGTFITRESYSYDNLYTELVADYEKYKMSCIVIDHSCALTKGPLHRTELEQVSSLGSSCRNFRKRYPVCVIVTSHLSSYASDELKKTGKVIKSSPTRGSGDLSKDADEVFILVTSPELEKQDLRGLQVYKRRDGGKSGISTVYLKVLYNGGEWVYDKKYQDGKVEDVQLTAAYDKIEQAYLNDDDGEIEIDLFA